MSYARETGASTQDSGDLLRAIDISLKELKALIKTLEQLLKRNNFHKDPDTRSTMLSH